MVLAFRTAVSQTKWWTFSPPFADIARTRSVSQFAVLVTCELHPKSVKYSKLTLLPFFSHKIMQHQFITNHIFLAAQVRGKKGKL